MQTATRREKSFHENCLCWKYFEEFSIILRQEQSFQVNKDDHYRKHILSSIDFPNVRIDASTKQ